MRFFDLINVRESCRKYTGEPIDTAQLNQILEAGRLAPSACNSQPWFFYVAESKEAMAQVTTCVQREGSNGFTDKAGAFIVIAEDYAQVSARVLETFGRQSFAQMDIGIVTAHMALAASELGLGTCIIGWYDGEKLKELLPLTEDQTVRLVLAVGHPADASPRKKVRKSMDEIVKYL